MTRYPTPRRGIAAVVAIALVAGLGWVTPSAAAPQAPTPVLQAAPPTPSPTPARTGTPASIVATGDSITQATGTGTLGSENPKNSWVTGWEINSIAARLGIPTNQRYNVSANGARMTHLAGQATNGKADGSVPAVPPTAGLVVIEMGGNDLCRDSVDQMTTAQTYRNQLRAGLQAINTRAPEALIQVYSIPDIYNLWYIRGGPEHPIHHPHPESDQASGLNGARFYWNQSWFPCGSLLSNPESYAQADRDRRTAVRDRTKALNLVLAQECAAVLRCRHDGNAMFDLTSNRVSPPDGPLLPMNQWTFTDQDISLNEGSGTWLCPVQGVIAGGCGDHFHPSLAGQRKLAEFAMDVGRDWSDTTAPTRTATPLGPTRPDGTYGGSVRIRFGGTDAAGLRGQEVRVHRPDGSVTPWQAHLGVAPDLTVTDFGVTHVEVRSLDVNGNQSASLVRTVEVTPAEPAAPPTPAVVGGPAGAQVSWTAPADGGSPITGFDLERLNPATGAATVVTTVGPAARNALVELPPGEVARVRVRARNAVGAGAWSPVSVGAVAPFATLSAFVDRQYRDFTGRGPTDVELMTVVVALQQGTDTPGGLMRSLADTPYWRGTLSGTVRLYAATFLRLPDNSGFAYWLDQRRGGRSITSIASFFAGSGEFRTRYGNLTDAQYVDRIYENVLERLPDASGRAFWLDRLQNGGWTRGRVLQFFSQSGEYSAKMFPTVQVVELLWAMQGRVPTTAELDTMLGRLDVDGYDALVGDLLVSAPYVATVAG